MVLNAYLPDRGLLMNSETGWRLYLATVYIIFMILWFGMIAFIMFSDVPIEKFGGFGIGAASGTFLTMFVLMWQFFWRRSNPG